MFESSFEIKQQKRHSRSFKCWILLSTWSKQAGEDSVSILRQGRRGKIAYELNTRSFYTTLKPWAGEEQGMGGTHFRIHSLFFSYFGQNPGFLIFSPLFLGQINLKFSLSLSIPEEPNRNFKLVFLV